MPRLPNVNDAKRSPRGKLGSKGDAFFGFPRISPVATLGRSLRTFDHRGTTPSGSTFIDPFRAHGWNGRGLRRSAAPLRTRKTSAVGCGWNGTGPITLVTTARFALSLVRLGNTAITYVCCGEWSNARLVQDCRLSISRYLCKPTSRHTPKGSSRVIVWFEFVDCSRRFACYGQPNSMQNWLEFQAVVMAAGKGSRITEMTATKPKCLLPVGNKPMIYYPLKLLESAGFTETKIIVADNYSSDIQEEVDNLGFEMNLSFVPIPSDEDWGTADSLRHISDYIQTDVIVLSCDLITDVDLHQVLNVFRKNNASLVSLYFPPSQDEQCIFTVPGPKSKTKLEKDIVGYDSNTSRLLLMASASDYEETMPLSSSLLHKCSNLTLCSKLLDSHMYIMKRWLVNYLVKDKNISTIKGELLPFVVKKQLSKHCKHVDKSEKLIEEDEKPDIFNISNESDIENNLGLMSRFDHVSNSEEKIKCYACIMDSNIGIRANTLFDYCKVNTIINKLNLDMGNEKDKISPEAEILSNQFDKETCYVGPNTKIMEKTSIKNSTIGSRCTINSKTRISDSILMNGVIIEEKCVLQNCIVCHDAVISAGCQLKDCLISGNFKVPSGENHDKEVLTATDRLMVFS